MGKFEHNIPETIKGLEAERKRLGDYIRLDFHDCDCEYCDRRTDSEMDEQKLEAAQQQISDLTAEIESLKRHAKLHGIEINNKELAPHV